MRKFLFTIAVILTVVLCSSCEPESVDTTFSDPNSVSDVVIV